MQNSQAIKSFLERLKTLTDEESFIQYDYEKYDCEIAALDEAISKRSIEDCLLFYAQQEDNQFLEVKHPIHNHINTRAVFSFLKEGDDVNFCYELIFFIDKENENPWLLMSSLHTVSYIITPEQIFRLSYPSMPRMFKGWIYEALKDKELCFKDITWGYNLTDMAPLHYFYDNLCFFLLLKTNKNVSKAPSFFIPKRYHDKQTTNEVYMVPKCLPVWFFYQKPSWHFINMGKELYEDSMQDFDKFVQKKDSQKYDLTIWLSLASTDWGKRWIEQIQGSANIIKELLKYFSTIKVYFDGLTSFDNSDFTIPRSSEATTVEKNLLEEIKKTCDASRVNVQSLHKFTFRQKICYCSTVDLSINEPASASVVPSLSCRKPCVFFGNHSYLWQVKISDPVKYCKVVEREFVKHYPKRKLTYWDGFYAYHIPWQHIYNLCADILEELSQDGKLEVKNLKMHRLEVPRVDIIAKKYDLSVKLEELKEQFHADKEELEDKFLALLADEFVKNSDNIQNLDSKISHLNQERINIENSLNETRNIIKSLPHQIQVQELNIKKLQVKKLEKELGLKLSKLEPRINLILNGNLRVSAAARMRNHLAYRLGRAMIENSKSLKGYIRMPYVLSYIKDQYKAEQRAYQALITKDPELKLPRLESYNDYNEALKIKEHLSYKLGEAFIKAINNAWGGGLLKFLFFDVRRIKRTRSNV